MRVLHLSTWKEMCGIAGYASDLVQELDALGIENEVFPINRRDMQYMSLEEINQHFDAFCDKAEGFEIVHIQHEHGFFCGPHPFRNSVFIFGKILERLRKSRVKHIIVTFHTEPFFLERGHLQGLPLKAAITERAKLNYYRWIWERQVARHFKSKRSDRFQAIIHSKRSRLKMLDAGFASERISIIPLGFPTKRRTQVSPEAQLQAKRDLGIPEEVTVLSLFGFISAYKGPDIAVRALATLPENYYLIIAGGPHPETDPREAPLQSVLALIQQLEDEDEDEELEISHRILITGFVPFAMLDTIHAATDICLAPYILTNLSASAAISWALTSGKPTIASKIPAFREMNESGQCFLLFQPSAHLELAWQVVNLTKDEQLQQDLVDNAKAYVEKYSWPSTAKQVSHLYKPE